MQRSGCLIELSKQFKEQRYVIASFEINTEMRSQLKMWWNNKVQDPNKEIIHLNKSIKVNKISQFIITKSRPMCHASVTV